MTKFETVGRKAEQAERWGERRWRWLAGGLSLMHLACALVLAERKLLWNDELYTYYIATQPTLHDLRQALLTGAEQIPWTFHLMTRAVLELVGMGPISIRTPQILGFLVMMWSLRGFVARGTSSFYGLIAMAFPLLTDAYRYAYEARPYGVMLGLAGLALISWQAAARGESRRLSLVMLTLSLAASLATHYYAILIFFALGTGELVRTWTQKRVDPAVWGAFTLAGIIPLLAFSEFMVQAANYSTAFWAQLHPSGVPSFYREMLAPASFPIAATLFVGLLYSTYAPHVATGGDRKLVPAHEVAAAIAFAALPLVAYVIALLVTKAFLSRYCVAAVIGLSVLPALGLYCLPRGRALMGVTFLAAVCCWFPLQQYRTLKALADQASSRFASIALLEKRASGGLPIVASEPHVFMSLAHYAPPMIRARLIYLSDPEASLRHLGHNSVDRGMLDLVGPWFHLPVEEFDSYVRANTRFWMYGNLGWLTWLGDELQDDGARIELKAMNGAELLFFVTLPHAGSSAGAGRKSNAGD